MNKPVSMIQVAIFVGIGCGISTAWIMSEIAVLRADLAKVVQPACEPEKMAPRPASRARHTLFDAIRQVESGGWDGKMIGPDGSPTDIGPYQVTWAWWQDAFEGTPYDSMGAYRRWAFDPDVCELGMDRYWARYKAVTDEEKARCHHRGPSKARWYDEAGDAYWAKVKKEMER